MALKDILVYVDGGKQTPELLEAAIYLAKEHDAHLTGVNVLPPINIPPYIKAELTTMVLAAQDTILRSSVQKAREFFEEATKRASLEKDWRVFKGDTVEVLNQQARFFDLVVLGQRDADGDGARADSGMPDRVILGVGRPVLTIPFAGKFPTTGKRIMLAWDGSRLATRAVGDAMPFLEAAKKVIVMTVNPKNGGKGTDDPGADMCLHLSRHGINAEPHHVYAEDIDDGSMLLSQAADKRADMLVMGAYGHSRWRELVLGGVTRHILEHMTVPVLMTH